MKGQLLDAENEGAERSEVLRKKLRKENATEKQKKHHEKGEAAQDAVKEAVEGTEGLGETEGKV